MTRPKRDNRKTLYLLMDTETTKNNGLVFDMAYELFDRNGLTYEYGSFLFTDVLAIEEPFFKDKIATYWEMVYRKKIVPMSIHMARFLFNRMLEKYTSRNYKVVICAYNASFDVKHLGDTSAHLNKEKFVIKPNKNLLFYDLMHGWVENCPVDYGWTAPWTREAPWEPDPRTGRPQPWNIKTSAESVYQYITGKPDFIEKHVAFEDIVIEKVILFDILKRKKKLYIVESPKDFITPCWQIAQERCKVPIKARKEKELAFRATLEVDPNLKVRLENEPTIIFPDQEPTWQENKVSEPVGLVDNFKDTEEG